MSERISAFDQLVERARLLAERPGRAVLGVTGAPGAGKSTLAEALVERLAAEGEPGWVAHVPMDGYHLADVELERLGRLGAKGAPDTYDAHGYAALLERLQDGREDEIIYAPTFERDLEQPLAGAIPVFGQCRLVVTEGNYLLLDEPGWVRARAALTEVWFVRLDDEVRRERLVRRHVAFGKSPDAAHAWVMGTDEPNAVRVGPTAAAADLIVEPAAVPAP